MSPRNLFIFNGIVCFLFGVPMIVAPSIIIDIYTPGTIEMSPFFKTITMAYGSLITSLGVALFLAVKASESYGRKAILSIVSIANIFLVFIHGSATLNGIENSNGWGLVILVAILAVWGTLLFIKEKPGQ